MTDPGAMLSTTHELADGSRVRIRLTRPSDAQRVRAFIDRLSPAARRRRLRGRSPVRALTFYDPRRRLVAAATMPRDGGERIVGLADVSLMEREQVAEVGLIVDEEKRGHGVGSLLSETAAALAAQRGAKQLKAPRDDGAARLLEQLGPTEHKTEDGTPVAYTRIPGPG